MIDAVLKIAYRVAPNALAHHISILISERNVERKWRATMARHIANGGVVASYRSQSGESSFLI